MMEQDELIGVFVEESIQHLESIEPDLLEMEKHIDRIDSNIVNGIFRAVHSVKGASGFFGFHKIGSLSHIMENLLSQLRDGRMKASSELVDALLTGMDALRAMLDDVGASEDFEIQAEIDRLTMLLNGSDASSNIVTLKEKTKGEKVPKTFDIPEGELDRFVRNGQFLYTIDVLLKRDLADKGKTPLDFINTIVTTGELIESRMDIDTIQGLSDCLENDVPFVFAFATILEEEYIPTALGISREQITRIDMKTQKQKEGTDQNQEPISEQPRMSQKSEALPLEMTESVSPKTDASLTPVPAGNSRHVKPENALKISNTIQTEEKIRVGVSFLNDLVNLAGEMVLGRNQLNQIAMPLVKETPGLNSAIQHISRITTEMQEKIMQMRMQPVSMIFGKFQRVVRDLAKNMNKEIKLITHGEEVELDKSIIEALSDPLTHLIRNSVDHGIEPPETREKIGKSKQGTIELKAYHQAGHVYIDIIDDGGGIDCRRVGEKAVEKGLITEEQLDEMGEKELARLIFKPGFSTAGQVSAVSGRGVGMDVVLTNIKQLGGTVDIDTTLHQGTCISLVLPLTLAIVSGLVIRTDGQFFILPEANIDELVRIKPDEIEHRINIVQKERVLRLRDILLPLISLGDVLGLNSTGTKKDTLKDRTEPVRVLVIKHGLSRFGLLVDAVENIEEIVVKPLPRYLKAQKCFSGASIMGNGSVSLILDAAGLFEKAKLHHVQLESFQSKAKTDRINNEKDLQTLLLFNNNTTEKFALPLELISRIERVSAQRIEKVKEQQYLQYQGDKLRLVFLEDYLPVSRPERSENDTIGVIIPKQMKHPMGIVIHLVEGTVHSVVDIDTTSITSPGLFGSAILENKITLLPDMYRLFELAAPEWYQPKDTSGRGEGDTSKRILLVEDTPFFRMIEKDYLISAGYEVFEAENGRQAMQILDEETVDAVILDIVMPEMDGWETIRAIREDHRLKHLPVMAVTSLAEDIDLETGLKGGFTQWEAKLNKERLLEKLFNMLKQEKEVA